MRTDLAPPRFLPPLTLRMMIGVVVALLGIVVTIAFVDRPVHDGVLSFGPGLQAVLLVVTEIGNSSWSIGGGLVLTLGFWSVARISKGRRRQVARRLQGMAGFLLTSVLASGISVSLIKNSIGRARPNTFDPAHLLDFKPFAFDAAFASFPSGHSTTAMTVAVTLCLLWPRLMPFWLMIGLAGAASRVMLGVHWPSDALAGSLYGTICTLAVAQAFANRGWVFVRARPVFNGRLLQALWTSGKGR